MSNAKIRQRRRYRRAGVLRRIDVALSAQPKLPDVPGLITRNLLPGWRYVATEPVYMGRWPEG